VKTVESTEWLLALDSKESFKCSPPLQKKINPNNSGQ